MKQQAIRASSKTYRKATNLLAEELDIELLHSKYPSKDFEQAVKLVGEEIRHVASKFYRIGIRRGYIKACDDVLAGQLKLENQELTLESNKVSLQIKVRFHKDDERSRFTYEFLPNELHFE
ncbi:MAG: hypothetical protein OXG08_06120 [Gammaproteobacteria bacterium]|nr:hypothetical protein [Gammaproteobacteria bacterium]